MGKDCARCKKNLPPDGFSKAQWKKKDSRLCLGCVSKVQTTSRAKTTTPSLSNSKGANASDAVPKNKAPESAAPQFVILPEEFLEDALPFAEFPPDVLLHICYFAHLPDILRLGCTCRALSRVVGDDWLWKRHIEKVEGPVPCTGEFSYKELAFHMYYNWRPWINVMNKPSLVTVVGLTTDIVPMGPSAFLARTSEDERIKSTVKTKESLACFDYGAAPPPSMIRKVHQSLSVQVPEVNVEGAPSIVGTCPFSVKKIATASAYINEFAHDSSSSELLVAIRDPQGIKVVSGKKVQFVPSGNLRLQHMYKGFVAALSDNHSPSELRIWHLQSSSDVKGARIMDVKEPRGPTWVKEKTPEFTWYPRAPGSDLREYPCPCSSCYRTFTKETSVKDHWKVKHMWTLHRTAPVAGLVEAVAPALEIDGDIPLPPTGGGWTDLFLKKDGHYISLSYGDPRLRASTARDDCVYLATDYPDGSETPKLACFNITTMEKQIYELEGSPTCMAASDAVVAVGFEDGIVCAYETRGGVLLARCSAVRGAIRSVEVAGSVVMCFGADPKGAPVVFSAFGHYDTDVPKTARLKLATTEVEAVGLSRHYAVVVQKAAKGNNFSGLAFDVHTGKLLRKWKVVEAVQKILVMDSHAILFSRTLNTNFSLQIIDFRPASPLSVEAQYALEKKVLSKAAATPTKVAAPAAAGGIGDEEDANGQYDENGEWYDGDGQYYGDGGYYDDGEGDGQYYDDRYYDDGLDDVDDFDYMKENTTSNYY